MSIELPLLLQVLQQQPPDRDRKKLKKTAMRFFPFWGSISYVGASTREVSPLFRNSRLCFKRPSPGATESQSQSLVDRTHKCCGWDLNDSPQFQCKARTDRQTRRGRALERAHWVGHLDRRTSAQHAEEDHRRNAITTPRVTVQVHTRRPRTCTPKDCASSKKKDHCFPFLNESSCVARKFNADASRGASKKVIIATDTMRNVSASGG